MTFPCKRKAKCNNMPLPADRFGFTKEKGARRLETPAHLRGRSECAKLKVGIIDRKKLMIFSIIKKNL